ncbi:hypothetical protein F5883DRAFT_35961 [Diaporthe sp. PMI_573]|nr:hypothetical protein F5883DRAFT_35961 [Diaporthaceae sp. PMI_573]
MGRFSRSSPDAFVFDRTVIRMTSSTSSQQFFQRRVYLYVKTEWHHTFPPLSLQWEGPLGCLLAVAGHIDQQPATKWSQVSYIHGTALLYNQARWLLCQVTARCAELCLPAAKAQFRCTPPADMSSVPWRRAAFKTFPDGSGARILSRPITSRSDITLRTQDTIDKTSFLLRPFNDSPPPAPAPRPAGLRGKPWRKRTLHRKLPPASCKG